MQPGEVVSTGAGQNAKGRMAELLRRASTVRRVDDGKGSLPKRNVVRWSKCSMGFTIAVRVYV